MSGTEVIQISEPTIGVSVQRVYEAIQARLGPGTHTVHFKAESHIADVVANLFESMNYKVSRSKGDFSITWTNKFAIT